MIFHILVGQRKCMYPGEYAPEALEVIDDNGMSDNPRYLMGKKSKYDESKEFDALAIVRVLVADIDIDNALYPATQVIDGTLLG